MKRKLQAVAVLILLGIVKVPLEHQANQRLMERHLLNPPMELDLLDNVGQMGFAAGLGGLRSLVATITYLQAYSEWEKVNWAKVDQLFQLAARLQPRYAKYWDEGAWHMAYNASSSYLHNTELQPAVRGQLYHDHIDRGIEILEQGLRVLPNDAKLWHSLAEIYQYRKHDYAKAAVCYEQVFRVTGNTRYQRFQGYMLAKTQDPASWRKAYEILKRAYDNQRREPTLIDSLKTLEEKLNVPPQDRITESVTRKPGGAGAVGP